MNSLGYLLWVAVKFFVTSNYNFCLFASLVPKLMMVNGEGVGKQFRQKSGVLW
jgi:hypothetical protein